MAQSSSKVKVVERYIQNQQLHNNKVSFNNELRIGFNEYKIDFDEQYVWD